MRRVRNLLLRISILVFKMNFPRDWVESSKPKKKLILFHQNPKKLIKKYPKLYQIL